jgi:hypothetical protein
LAEKKRKEKKMGAEAETGQEKQGAEKPRPNSITPAQFLSWKRQKVLFISFFLSIFLSAFF